MNFVNRILERTTNEAEAELGAVAEYFNAARRGGFTDAVKQTAAEHANKFRKDELERLRHEHRRNLREIKANIEEERYCFCAWHLAFSVTWMLGLPLFLLTVIAIIFAACLPDMILVRCLAIIAAAVFIADLVMHGLVRRLMRQSLQNLTEQYTLHGIAEGMLSLSDYRGLETIDLSKLPDTSYFS